MKCIKLWDFKMPMDHPILARRPDQVLNIKKKWTYHLIDFAVSVGHRVKIKARKKIDKCLNLAREMKMLWNMNMTVIANVVGVLWRILRNLEKNREPWDLRKNWNSPDHNSTASLAWMLRRILESWGDLLQLRLQWKPPVTTNVQN